MEKPSEIQIRNQMVHNRSTLKHSLSSKTVCKFFCLENPQVPWDTGNISHKKSIVKDEMINNGSTGSSVLSSCIENICRTNTFMLGKRVNHMQLKNSAIGRRSLNDAYLKNISSNILEMLGLCCDLR